MSFSCGRLGRYGERWCVLFAFALVLSACAPDLRPGQFSCSPNREGECPPGWQCVTFGTGYTCSPWLAGPTDCGNGVLDPGEECDWLRPIDINCGDFPNRGTERGYCERNCIYSCPYQCGDAIVQGAEECDDGDNLPGDGCSAQCLREVVQWRLIQTDLSPPARSSHGMANDPVRDQLILFGGDGGVDATGMSITLGDTWIFENGSWRELPCAPGGCPAPRHLHAMTYDPLHGVTVMKGGLSATGLYLQDTWIFDDDAWSPVEPDETGLYSSAMTGTNVGALTFGGLTGMCCASTRDDTRVFDGSTWHVLEEIENPVVRWEHALASDGERVLLHGGIKSAEYGITVYFLLADTWLWEDGDWTLQEGYPLAPTRQGHAMAYFSPWQKFLLFGGAGPPNQTLHSDTWIFEPVTANWIEAATTGSPSARWLHRMVSDVAGKRVLLFGGQQRQDGELALSAELWVASVESGEPP